MAVRPASVFGATSKPWKLGPRNFPMLGKNRLLLFQCLENFRSRGANQPRALRRNQPQQAADRKIKDTNSWPPRAEENETHFSAFTFSVQHFSVCLFLSLEIFRPRARRGGRALCLEGRALSRPLPSPFPRTHKRGYDLTSMFDVECSVFASLPFTILHQPSPHPPSFFSVLFLPPKNNLKVPAAKNV